jgi:CBS domain-containing protein
VKAKKAEDIAIYNSSSFSVKENDSYQAVLDLMIDREQDIIPVVDNEGRIIGDLSLSELLLKVLEVGI